MVNEADVETAALSWLSSLGWQTAYGPDIAPDTQGAERTDFTQVVLEERLRDALSTSTQSSRRRHWRPVSGASSTPEGPTLEARNRPSTMPSPGE